MNSQEHVRVRFAPSPTGYLHVGGARTALFNWLFARHCGGEFILRIEDTDVARSSAEMVEGILQGMRWLGLTWDEGPYFQSNRLDRYRDFAARLIESGHAYRCFCGSKNSEPKDYKENPTAGAGHPCPLYSAAESDRRAANGEPFAIRYRVTPGRTTFKDQVFGKIEVDHATLEDFVLLRSDGIPTYHLGVVVDDIDMRITHVIRGADHISNTPKQILLYQAADAPLPHFAHLPLILGPDRQRLSKRHGATSVMSYAETGYLPEAFFNFLALLGWSPGDDREILSRQELIELFTLEGVGKADAVFGIEKLEWFNSQYIRNMPREQLAEMVRTELEGKHMWDPSFFPSPDSFHAAIELLKPRAKKITDFSSTFKAFFSEDFHYEETAAARFLSDPRLRVLLPELTQRYAATPSFTLQSTEDTLRRFAEEKNVKAALLINALRVGLTGQGVAPGLFDIMQVLGRQKTLDRMQRLSLQLQGE